MKLFKPPIPPEEQPEGIRLSIENCKRLVTDAKILFDNKRYSSAIMLLILAKEEFAKALLLLNHEKDGLELSVNKVKEYFSDHEIRLEEFGKYFHRSLGSEMPEDGFAFIWRSDKDTREKYTYVDWTQLGWSYPEYKPPKHWKFKDESVFDKSKVESFMADLKQVFWKLEQDPDYKKAILKKNIDRPDGDKLYDIIKGVTGLPKPTSQAEIKQSKIKIVLEVPDISKKSVFESRLKQKLSERFPKYKVDMIIKKKTT